MKEKVSIEEMERKRFYVLLIKTIVVLLWSIVLVCKWWVFGFGESNKIISYSFIGGTLLFVVITWWVSSVLEKIKKDKKIEQALESELYTFYNYKAVETGFYAALISGVIVFCVGLATDIPASLAAFLVAVSAGIASDIRRLILYRP